VIAATRTFRFERKRVLNGLLEGFFPKVDADAPPPERRRGMREMGLPYAADPAITRHLLQFLRSADRHADNPTGIARPSRILFNGGAMLPEILREQVATTVGDWCGLEQPLPHLHSEDLNLAVSRGAAYYGLVRRGSGVRVKGGIARAYYLEVDEGEESALVCVMPRDTDEEQVQELDRTLSLRTNQPVIFPLHASATRLGDQLGDRIAEHEEMTPLPPLTTVLRYGKKDARAINVRLAARLNAVGTLELWLKSRESDHVYPLRFDLRAGDGKTLYEVGATLDEALLKQAENRLESVFGGTGDPRKLTAELEAVLELSRTDWGVLLLRRFADTLLRLAAARTATPTHEARWFNLTGFAVRPGFGCAGDEWRSRELWKLWHGGPGAGRNAQVAAEWWVLWRRIAGGLRAGQQQQIAGKLMRELITTTGKRLDPKKRNPQEAREMWRCLGALERLTPKIKLRILRRLRDAAPGLRPHHYWVIARAGARKLFYGPADAVIPAAKLEPLLPTLFRTARADSTSRMALLAVSNLCRLTGIRGIDINDATRTEALGLLEDADAPTEWRRHLQEIREDSERYQAEIAGDALPLGLVLCPRIPRPPPPNLSRQGE
jgi:hypothetical protein